MDTNNGITLSLNELLQCRYYSNNMPLFSNKQVRTHQLGGHRSSQRGRGIDFDEVRGYQAGDDIRCMHWGVTARTGMAHIKLYHEERERPVYLIIDLHPSMFFGSKIAFKSVIAAKMAALLGWAAIDNGDRLGAFIFNGEQTVSLPPRSRKYGILPLLKILTEMTTAPANHIDEHCFHQTLQKCRHVIKPGSLVFLISDFFALTDPCKSHLLRLSQQNEVIACWIYDRLERNIPPPNRYAITNGTQSTIINTEDKRLRQRYFNQLNEHYQRIAKMLLHCQIHSVDIATHTPITTSIRNGLSQRTRSKGVAL